MYIDYSLTKRDLWANNTEARWAFFAIFIVIILLVVVGTMRVNKKRGNTGLQPIYGTRWMTPPSYGQSQTQYNQPSRPRGDEVPSNYVPTYTETANDQDMGYYDVNGEFHANPNAAKGGIPPYHADNEIVNNPAHHRSSATDGIALSDMNSLNDVSRPAGPPPRTTTDSSVAAPNSPPPNGSLSSSSTRP